MRLHRIVAVEQQQPLYVWQHSSGGGGGGVVPAVPSCASVDLHRWSQSQI